MFSFIQLNIERLFVSVIQVTKLTRTCTRVLFLETVILTGPINTRTYSNINMWCKLHIFTTHLWWRTRAVGSFHTHKRSEKKFVQHLLLFHNWFRNVVHSRFVFNVKSLLFPDNKICHVPSLWTYMWILYNLFISSRTYIVTSHYVVLEQECY